MRYLIIGMICAGIFAMTTPIYASAEELDAIKSGVEQNLEYGIRISGTIGIEAVYQNKEKDEDNSDVDLATAEIAIDADIVKHVSGHILFSYDAEEENVFVDEGYITLSGDDRIPAYLIAGRQYIPFGNFDSHFISDPATLTLGETNEGALVGGYTFAANTIEINIGFFNGKIKKTDEDDTITNMVAAVVYSPSDDITIGTSYTSNLAAAEELSEVVIDSDTESDNVEINHFVGGWSIFATVNFMQRFRVVAEYVTALDEFEEGELYSDTDSKRRKPQAWNLELGYAINDAWEVAARYAGAEDGAEFLPEIEYGAVINWLVFKNTGLSLEYLHADFEDDAEQTDTVTVEFAVEF